MADGLKDPFSIANGCLGEDIGEHRLDGSTWFFKEERFDQRGC